MSKTKTPNPQFHGVMIDVGRVFPTLVNITTDPQNDSKPMIIYDLDGTLADDSKRKHHLFEGQKNFDAYMSEIDNDDPIWPVVEQLVRDAKGGAVITLLTGRNDDYLTKTIRQIHKFQIAPFVSSLVMRCHNDFRSAAEFKADAIGLLAAEGAIVAGIVDDDESVRKMASELGLQTFDPAEIVRQAKEKESTPKLILPPGY